MKAVATLLVIAGLIAGIYFVFVAESPAYVTYKKFATALAYGRHDEALQYADSEETLGEDQNRKLSAGGLPVDALTDVSFARESESKDSDGNVTVQAIESVRFDPPGQTSAMGSMTSKYRQTATLGKTSDGWRVISFESTFLETRNWKGEKE